MDEEETATMQVINTTKFPRIALSRMAHWVRRECNIGGCIFLKILFRHLKSEVYTNRLSRELVQEKDRNGDVVMVVRGVGTITIPTDRTELATEDWYMLVLHVGALMAKVGGPAVPNDQIGFFRQQCGADFMADSEKWISEWMYQAEAPDPLKKHKEDLAWAEKRLAHYQRRQKLAETKIKKWSRKVKSAKKRLQSEV